MDGAAAARGRLLVVACGAALIAISFVPLWATYRVPGLGIVGPTTVHQNAWTAFGLGMQVALVAAIAAVAFAGLSLATQRRAAGAAAPLTALCALATVLLLWQTFVGPAGSSDPNGYGISRGALLFVGTGLSCCMTYGGYLVLRGNRSGQSASWMMGRGRTHRGE